MEYKYDFDTKDGMISKLTNYVNYPDDDCIRCKELIKDELLHCPELLYLLHETDYEGELFDEDGNLTEDGDWDIYFGAEGNIRPYVYFPETQEKIRHYVCYRVVFDDSPRNNAIEKYLEVTFYVYVNMNDAVEAFTGLSRHDLICSILREKFNWSNVFGMQCKSVSDAEGMTDNHFIYRTLTFQFTTLNSIVKTNNNTGTTKVINNRVRTF